MADNVALEQIQRGALPLYRALMAQVELEHHLETCLQCSMFVPRCPESIRMLRNAQTLRTQALKVVHGNGQMPTST